MIKIIPPNAWAQFSDRPQVEEVKISSSGLRGHDFAQFIKYASHPLASWVRMNPPQPGEIYVHSVPMGSTEKFGCFFAGAPVETEQGHRPIEKVQIGDLVLTHKNRYRKVITKFVSEYSGPKTTIRASGMPEPMISTGEHPYWAVRAEDLTAKMRCEAYLIADGRTKIQAIDAAVADKSQFLPADQLRKGDYLIIPTRPQAVEKKTYAQRWAYLLGVYLAEGCIVRENRKYVRTCGEPKQVLLTVSKNDTAVLQRIRHDTDYELREGKSCTSSLGIRSTIHDKALAVECLSLFGGHSTTKRIPAAVFEQSLDWKLDFLAGYLDGDGCIEKKPGRYQGTVKASTASLNLAEDLIRLLANVGIPAGAFRCMNREKNGCFGTGDHVIYQVNIGSAYSSAIVCRCQRLKMPDVPPRKRQAPGQVGSHYLLVPVTEAYTELVNDLVKYNFEVEEDNSYVVHTAVHNCNRNGDGYTEAMLERDHVTFMNIPARWYYNHKNAAHDDSYGVVKQAIFNKDLGRVEAITALNATKEAAERNRGKIAKKTLDKLASNVDVAVSMSCRVPYDVCSSCNNQARNRSEYCGPQTCKYGGCRDNLGRVFDDGFHLFVDNPKCAFFDLSDVSDTRGADRTAFVTGKVASPDRIIGGAELAEQLGLVPPDYLLDPATLGAVSSLRKLAADPQVKHLPASSWDECLKTREKRAHGFVRQAPNPGDDHARHRLVAELAQDGVVLPPARWLAYMTGAPLEKCASLFAHGVDPSRLLASNDLHDRIASASYSDSRLSPPTAYAWMAPSVAAHADESAYATITGPAKFASVEAPPAVREEAELRYLAYQSCVLAKHAHTPQYLVLLAECARHNTGQTI